MGFDAGKAAREARNRDSSWQPSGAFLMRSVLGRVLEQQRGLYSGPYGNSYLLGSIQTRAWQALQERRRDPVSAALGSTRPSEILARGSGVASGYAPLFGSIRSSLFLHTNRAWPELRSAGMISRLTGTAGTYRISGLYSSIAASLGEAGLGTGAVPGDAFTSWHLRHIRGSRGAALRSVLGRAGTFSPWVVTPEREAEEETEYHPDLRSWDAPETARDEEERWAEGVARGIARFYGSPVLVSRMQGGARWMIRVARRHAGISSMAIGAAGGLAVGAVTGEVAVEAIRGGVTGASTYLCYLLTRD